MTERINVPEGAELYPLYRFPSENLGCTPGFYIYTKSSEGTEPTGYSLLDYEKTSEGVHRSEIIDNMSARAIAATELRRGTKGAVLITEEGESVHLTATAALGVFMSKLQADSH